MTGFDRRRLDRLADVMAGHVDDGSLGGAAWLAARDDDVVVGCVGVPTRGTSDPVQRDTIFRIASMTKPIVAAAALILVEECRLHLHEPIADLVPELADPRVLVDPHGPIDGESVPAQRSITLYDVLTSRLGWGMDFEAPWPQPLVEAMAELSLGTGPPRPQEVVAPDEWIRRMATLPLLYQPGERWLYNTGSDVLGVLVSRAAGQPLDVVLRERVFEPLGMSDTGFATAHVERLGSCYGIDPETGEPVVFDPPAGQWSTPPAFPSGAGGLVSTIDDYRAFARMLLSEGRLPDGSRLLSPSAVRAMTTDQLSVPGAGGPSPDGSQGWGFGVGVTIRRTGPATSAGAYGWSGGLGSSWANDPQQRLIGIVLTTDLFTSAFPAPRAIQDFWTCVYAAIDD
jgi:CubicO group peptidase (beta-lactamase class C family)